MNTKRILLTGSIVAGDFDWHISPLPTPTDGELQRLIDDGEKASATFGKMLLAMVGDECLDDTAEYEDDILDREDWSRGGW